MKEKSPVQRIWELGEAEYGGLIAAVVLAVVGVACGMAPYFAAALCGYLLRTALYNGALSVSHQATFRILKTIRQKLLAKLPKLPLGTVVDTASGKLKQIIVNQVDSMETTLAHLFPEMTANITAPVLTLVYLFVLD